MRPLSASEAIGPALERTKDVLLRPFRWQTFFKIAAVAFFAEMGGFNSSSFSNGSGGTHDLPPAMLAFIVAFAVIIGLISLAIGLILLYIGSRLQLVLVELVATRQTTISPMWRRVSMLTWRWIGFKLFFFVCILAVAVPFVVPLILFFVHHGRSSNPFSGLHITEILLLAAAAIVAVIVIAVIYTLVRDLALPSISLEGVPLSEALRRLRALVNAEPGQVAIYVLLRMLLGVVFGLIAEMAVVILLLISLIPPGVIGAILWALLHKAGAGGTVALVGLGILGVLIFLCWAAFVVINLIGAVLIFNQAYALYFLGGRYPLLGDLLDRSTPPPAYAYPLGYPPPMQAPPPPSEPPSTPPLPEPPPATS
ncbi:MAG TPA: hypothetical protein VGN01_12635 [Acidobacteriaceae bacterium]|jgi:hypothetical protein